MKLFEISNSWCLETKISILKKFDIASGDSDARFMISSALNEKDSQKVAIISMSKIIGAASFYHTKTKETIIEFLGSVQSGVGSELLNYIIEQAKKSRSKKILIWSTQEGDNLYKKFGFKEIGNEDGHMVKEL